jgi:hypothetical protein
MDMYGCDPMEDIKYAREEREKESEMPHMTTTEQLMSPGPDEELEG